MAVNKVKVKIAVAVGPDGDWYAIGCSHLTEFSEKEAWGVATDQLKAVSPAKYWVTAALTVPEIKAVKASEVEQVESKTDDEGS